MRIVRGRKQCCPEFSHVILREDDAACRLPRQGVPEHIACCALEVEGSENHPFVCRARPPVLQKSAGTTRLVMNPTRIRKVSATTTPIAKPARTRRSTWPRPPLPLIQFTTWSLCG